MALSAFTDRNRQPAGEDLQPVLAGSHAAWVRFIALVENRIGPVSRAWGFTSASTGWGLRLKRGDRVIVYLTPGEGRFLVSFALGEKAVAAARATKLPAAILQAIDAAPRYAEGRGVRFEVRLIREVAPLAILAQVKHEH